MSWTTRPPIRSPFGAPTPDGDAHRSDDDAAGAAGAAPVRILTVCTGNICRSAYAQHVLQARLDELLGCGRAEVGSAGTGPNQALAVPDEILHLAPSSGVMDALLSHRPRQLTARVLAGQDLVLTATEAHLDAVLREEPGAVRRAYTLLEAGRLAAGTDLPDAGGLPALTTAWAARRDTLTGDPLDLPDPFRGPVAGYAAMADALDPALEAIAQAVARAVGGAGTRS